MKQQKAFKPLCEHALQLLKKHLSWQTHCALLGIILMGIELGIFLYFFLFSGKTLIPAFCLSCFFLTLFVFIVIRLHFLSKKSEVFENLTEQFLSSVEETMLPKKTNVGQRLCYRASGATELALFLQNLEYTLLSDLFSLPQSQVMQKLSCFCFWKDLFLFRENLLQQAIDAHIKLVQADPTATKVHVALAAAYVSLSGLYADPRKYPDFDTNCWIPEARYDQSVQEKFFLTAKRAIEEFKILNEYAPESAWVYSQLAYSYHDLQMPLEEIQAYEMVLQLQPNDTDTMAKLGERYFRQGLNVKGLQIYAQLRGLDIKKAENIIKYYGC